MSSESPDSENKRFIIIAVIFIFLMFLNYYLIFLSDTVVNFNRIFHEEGVIESDIIIPKNPSFELFEISSGLNRRTYLTIEGFNSTCIIMSLRTNTTYEIILNNSISNYKLVFNNTDNFYVLKSIGNPKYRYEVYSIEKPLLFLAVIAFMISVLGLGFGLYIFMRLILSRV